MKQHSGTKLNYRSYAAIGIVTLLGLMTVSCNSGGGGGDDDGGNVLTSTLNYYLDAPRAGTPELSAHMTGLDVTFNNLKMQGTLTPAVAPATDDSMTLSSSTTSVGSLATGALFGDLPVFVTQPFSWTGSNHPTAGEFTVTLGATEWVRATVNNALAGGAGVQVTHYVNSAPVETADFLWDVFEVLWEDVNASTYKRVASFVYGTRSFLFDQVGTALEAMHMIEDNRAALEAAPSKSVTVPCSANPPSGIAPNTITLTWTDVDGSGTINSVTNMYDTIEFTFNNCWADDPTDDIDAILNGKLRFNYYEPHLQWGIAYIDFVITETLNNVPDPESEMTINGGFAFLAAGM